LVSVLNGSDASGVSLACGANIDGKRGILAPTLVANLHRSSCVGFNVYRPENQSAEPIDGSDVGVRHASGGARVAPSLTRINSTFGNHMKIRGGIRIGNVWETWPSAQLRFEEDRILLDYRGKYTIPKANVTMLTFLRGTLFTEIQVKHTSEEIDSPFRFFPLFAGGSYAFASAIGYPCLSKRAPFYSKGDIRFGID
jgi:hypothetical protein